MLVFRKILRTYLMNDPFDRIITTLHFTKSIIAQSAWIEC